MTRTLVGLCGLLLVLPALVAEEKKFDAEARARSLAAFVEPDTLALVRFDLARMKPDEIVNAVTAAWPEDSREEAEEALKTFGKRHATLTRAGVKDVVVTFAAPEFPFPSAVSAVLGENADAEAVTGFFREQANFGRATRIDKEGNVVTAGLAAALDRRKRAGGEARSEVRAALEAAGDTAVQALLLPTNDVRRIVEELIPTLPRELGGAPGKTVTRGVRWAALGLDLPPRFGFTLTAQAADAEAARKTSDLSQTLLRAVEDAVGREKEKPPEFDRVLAALKPKVDQDRLVVSFRDPDALRDLVAVATGVLDRSVGRATRSRDANALKQMLLALHNYHDVNGRFPPHAIYSKEGKPLLSWRVAILPYVEHDDLYRQFHLDEPWDSAHNKKLLEQMPALYRSSRMKVKERSLTTFLAPVGKDLLFTGTDKGVAIKEITDGTSRTIALVDASDEKAVPWTRPADLEVDLNNPAKGLAGHYPDVILVGFADGSVHALPKTLDAATLKALFTRNGGEAVSYP